FGEAAVVRGHLVGADALGQLARHPLGQSAGVDEDQRGAVRRDQLGQALIDLLPDLGRHHGLERRGRKFEGEIAGTAEAAVAGWAKGGGGVSRRVEAGAGAWVGPAPTRKRATASIGFWVAERPTRSSRSPQSAASRSSESDKWVPRLLAASAWISSTITVRAV